MTPLLYVVPAPVEGRWTIDGGTLELTQTYQMVTGTRTTEDGRQTVAGRLRGTTLTLQAGDTTLTGTVSGDRIDGPTLRARREK